MPDKIPLSVLVTTRNEARNLARCLAALERFEEIVVIDSHSTDETCDIAPAMGAGVVMFDWNGQYPKKRQWCLDTLSLKHDRVFFVDADEELTPELAAEIAALDWSCAGYFVKGAYVVDGRTMRFGQKNNKLCLFDRHKIAFPVVDDLDIPGMGEIEGHYQPVLKAQTAGKLGQLKNPLRHHALEDKSRWAHRHDGYAIWQRGVESRRALPRDPSLLRHGLKTVFAKIPFRSGIAFLHSYIIKGGIFDGKRGLKLALSRKTYYENNNFLLTKSSSMLDG